MVARRRGYEATGGTPVNTKDKTAYTGQKYKRSDEANKDIKSDNQYSNTYNWTNSRGDSLQIGLATDNPKESGHYEYQSWAGRMIQENSMGDTFSGTTGCSTSSGKKGENSTFNGPSDTAKYNTCRGSFGNLDNQQDLAKGGGGHEEWGGNRSKAIGGMETEWSAMASGSCEYHIGKKGINAEGGCHIGVNKGSTKNVWTRWEPDGTYHLQVKPAGAEGGKMTMKVTPDGNITVTTDMSMSVDAKQNIVMKAGSGMTIETPTLTIKADIQQDGNFNESGVHTDNKGTHTHCPC